MTRDYDIEYEIQTTKPEEIKKALYEEWYDIGAQDRYDPDSHVLTVSGTTWLGGGMDEREAHLEIVKVVKEIDPEAHATTRWNCLEWEEWEEFTD